MRIGFLPQSDNSCHTRRSHGSATRHSPKASPAGGISLLHCTKRWLWQIWVDRWNHRLAWGHDIRVRNAIHINTITWKTGDGANGGIGISHLIAIACGVEVAIHTRAHRYGVMPRCHVANAAFIRAVCETLHSIRLKWTCLRTFPNTQIYFLVGLILKSYLIWAFHSHIRRQIDASVTCHIVFAKWDRQFSRTDSLSEIIVGVQIESGVGLQAICGVNDGRVVAVIKENFNAKRLRIVAPRIYFCLWIAQNRG